MDHLMTLEEVSTATGVPIATLRYIRATKPQSGPRMFVLAGAGIRHVPLAEYEAMRRPLPRITDLPPADALWALPTT